MCALRLSSSQHGGSAGSAIIVPLIRPSSYPKPLLGRVSAASWSGYRSQRWLARAVGPKSTLIVQRWAKAAMADSAVNADEPGVGVCGGDSTELGRRVGRQGSGTHRDEGRARTRANGPGSVDTAGKLVAVCPDRAETRRPNSAPRFRAADQWHITRIDDPAVLVAASDLFDFPVSPDGAADFFARRGHVLLMASDFAEHAIGFVSGVEMQHPDKAAEMFVYRSLGATIDEGSVFVTWDEDRTQSGCPQS